MAENKDIECKFTDCKDNFMTQEGDLYLVRCPKCLTENYHSNVATGMCAWCGWIAKDNVSDKEIIKLELRLKRELELKW